MICVRKAAVLADLLCHKVIPLIHVKRFPDGNVPFRGGAVFLIKIFCCICLDVVPMSLQTAASYIKISHLHIHLVCGGDLMQIMGGIL